MTTDKQNHEIMLACGFKYDPKGKLGFNRATSIICWPYVNKEGNRSSCKNFTEDLNAMHDAEKTLGDKLDDYEDALCYVVGRFPRGSDAWSYQGITATAAQRAEAFLKTIGKWVE